MVHKNCHSPPRSPSRASSLKYISLAVGLVERSLIAIVAAYLIYWPISYLISYRVFKLDIKWSATLASGVSICGVSAAIATAAAIGAPSIVPATVASIIVLFAAVELVILPFIAATFLKWAPYAAGAGWAYPLRPMARPRQAAP
ncbi:YeiH family protein [Vulcanisaeta sp. JCM 16161]|uniref:putative sulfate exporter family transporter n=1 Tax=Vulcanisaeta sp. JCM 16161 TaxID=1295372 RepID=UPI001FB3D4B3|nr:putative sulfate exporter family transporter [Vulcanisaeta sp. JCM 16161]